MGPAPSYIGRKLDDGTIQWGGFPSVSWHDVATREEADRVSFLCPKCYTANGGKVGTHRIAIDFVGGRQPDEDCMHNDQGQPVRWTVSCDTFETLDLKPSIQILGGCNWHGFINYGFAEGDLG